MSIDANQHINVERVIANLPKKPFLGGFRHKVTGVEFLNASCQTNSVKFMKCGVSRCFYLLLILCSYSKSYL